MGIDAQIWAEKFMEAGALLRLYDLAAKPNVESAMDVSKNTRSLCAVLFSKVYVHENMYYDKARDQFTNTVDSYCNGPDIEAKVHVVALLTSLLTGPVEVRNSFVGRPGILQMILIMANCEDRLQQRAAAAAIIATASKKDKAKGIIAEGINILKRLYQSKNNDIKVRASVGLAKWGSSGRTDANFRPFSEGANIKLIDEACRRFLLNPAKDVSVQRWAVEGLSYLSLDVEGENVEVKEKIVEDTRAVKTLLEMSLHVKEMGEVLYPIITTLVNLANAYDKQDLIPEMVELAKFAKHHIPEEHEFDDPDFVAKQVEVLIKNGVTDCLVKSAKGTESGNILELIARLMNAICEQGAHRGVLVTQGGARGSFFIFSPRRRIKTSRTALEKHEALLALCDLASETENLRKRICEEDGFAKVEPYMYEDHSKLRTAGVQCLTNLYLALSESVQKGFEGDNDRVKFLALLCKPQEDCDVDDDEIETMKAAAGGLAIVSSNSRVVCGKILTGVKDSIEISVWVVANLQLKGVAIVKNMVELHEQLGEQLFGPQIFEA